MMMKTGELWHCMNPQCHCEVLVRSDSEIAGSHPRCVCGAPMKKKYTAPAFTYLDFLQPDEPVSARRGSNEG
jgi:hypothetical protein